MTPVRYPRAWSVRMGGLVEHAPVVSGDSVLAVDSAGRLAAVGAADGAPRWAVQLPAGPSGSPRVAGGVAYVATGTGTVRAFDAGTGEPRWQVDAPVHVGTPTADGAGNLLVTGADAADRHDLVSVDPETGRERWTHRFPTPFVPTVTVAGDAVLVHQHGGRCVRLDAATGTLVWSVLHRSQNYGYAPVTEHAGVVYAGNGDGDLVALDLADGTARWEVPAIRTDLEAREHPGDIFFSQPQMRYAPGHVAAPVVVGDTLVTLQRNGRLSGVRTATGGPGWSAYLVPPPRPTLAVAAGRVLVLAGSRVRARDPRTGAVDGTVRLGLVLQGGSYPVGAGRAFYTGVGRRLVAYAAPPP